MLVKAHVSFVHLKRFKLKYFNTPLVQTKRLRSLFVTDYDDACQTREEAKQQECLFLTGSSVETAGVNKSLFSLDDLRPT
jgi:hypothetical protein